MLSNNKQPTHTKIPSSILLYVDEHSTIFSCINIEYYSLYFGVTSSVVKYSILQGLNNNYVGLNKDLRRRPKQWATEYNTTLADIAQKLTLQVRKQLRKLPASDLKRLPLDTEVLKDTLKLKPNNFLCHFHLGWIYSLSNNLTLAEKHFNLAALLSQNINKDFSCFAYRHLANTRLRNNKLQQAILAIEAACSQSTSENAELLFEKVRILSQANQTTRALSHIANLVQKDSYYASLASQDVIIQSNPSVKRFFDLEKEKHIHNIKNKVIEHWKNDPLHLLNLDKELGQKNTREIILSKQAELIKKLPTFMIYNETISSKFIQKKSREIIIKSLNTRKQQFIQQIEDHQRQASKAHNIGQWMMYIAIIGLISLGLSYAISGFAHHLNYHLPVNLTVQNIVLFGSALLAISGIIFLHFTPSKLTDLLKQKKRIETLSMRLGLSNG